MDNNYSREFVIALQISVLLAQSLCQQKIYFNFDIISFPKTSLCGGETLFRKETAGHKNKDQLRMELGVEAKRDILSYPFLVMAFKWRCLSVNNLCSRFSCRLVTTTSVMECCNLGLEDQNNFLPANVCKPTTAQQVLLILVKRAWSEQIST